MLAFAEQFIQGTDSTEANRQDQAVRIACARLEQPGNFQGD